jgi:hypothetical protein
VGRKNRQNENRVTEDVKGRHVQENSTGGQWSRADENLSEWGTYNIRKTDISMNSSPRKKTLELFLVPPGDQTGVLVD